ncbi:TetR/AcrR family transcriptional regulator [Scytonema sp. NUACC21]
MSCKVSFLRRLPKQKRSKQGVDRILDAAAEVFMEVGYEAATTHMIAARAKTAIGSLYQFFPDKLAIFSALEVLYIEQGRALGRSLFTKVSAQLSLEQFIEQMLDGYIQFLERPVPRIIFMQYFANPKMFRWVNSSFTQEFVKPLSNALKLWNPALTSEKCDLLANVCIQCFNTLMFVALQSEEPYRQELLKQIRDLLTSYLRPYVRDEDFIRKS